MPLSHLDQEADAPEPCLLPRLLPGFLPPSRSVVDLLITYSGAALASPASLQVQAVAHARLASWVPPAQAQAQNFFPKLFPPGAPQHTHTHPTTHNPQPYPHPAAPTQAHPIHPTPPLPCTWSRTYLPIHPLPQRPSQSEGTIQPHCGLVLHLANLARTDVCFQSTLFCAPCTLPPLRPRSGRHNRPTPTQLTRHPTTVRSKSQRQALSFSPPAGHTSSRL